VVSILEAALIDKEVEMRQTAAAALGDIKSRASIPKLKEALSDVAPEVSFTAARALWNMGDKSGRDIFMEVLAGERADSGGLLKSSMRDAKAKLHNPAALAMLGIKESAGMFLGPFAMGFTVFEELRKDASASARTLSAALLSTDDDPNTISSLEGALQDKNWIVRAAAAKALSARSSTGSVTKLVPLLEDKQEGARDIAAAAIIKLDVDARKARVKKTPAPKKPVAQPLKP
jgi:HEAT repeat protein